MDIQRTKESHMQRRLMAIASIAYFLGTKFMGKPEAAPEPGPISFATYVVQKETKTLAIPSYLSLGTVKCWVML